MPEQEFIETAIGYHLDYIARKAGFRDRYALESDQDYRRLAKAFIANQKTLRLVLKENERVDVEGPITIIGNRKADLVFQGTGKIGRRYFKDEIR